VEVPQLYRSREEELDLGKEPIDRDHGQKGQSGYDGYSPFAPEERQSDEDCNNAT
jgi:hypothetical protein